MPLLLEPRVVARANADNTGRLIAFSGRHDVDYRYYYVDPPGFRDAIGIADKDDLLAAVPDCLQCARLHVLRKQNIVTFDERHYATLLFIEAIHWCLFDNGGSCSGFTLGYALAKCPNVRIPSSCRCFLPKVTRFDAAIYREVMLRIEQG